MQRLLFIMAVSFMLFNFTSEVLAEDFNDSKINTLASNILNIVKNNNNCKLHTDCRSIGFGSRPCGGYERYLIYSARGFDDAELKSKAEKFYKLTKQYSKEMNIGSICMLTPEPKLACLNNVCVNANSLQLK